MSSSPVKRKVFSPDANTPLPLYSQAIISKGFVFVSGNLGVDRNTKLVEGGVQAQTRAVLESIKKVLNAAGTSLDNVVKVNVYVADLKKDFQPMNEVYLQYFGTQQVPARTCVQVAVLPLDAAVEIDCVARIP